MLNKSRFSAVLMLVFFLTGCASIVGKGLYPVTVNSHPDAATILITDERGKQMYRGTTPATITLSSGEAYFHAKKYTITFSKPGYEDQTVEVKAGLSGWYVGNIVFGGLIGALIVDPITGKMWKLPLEANATLVEQTGNYSESDSQAESDSSSGEQTLQISSIDQVPEKLRTRLARLN